MPAPATEILPTLRTEYEDASPAVIIQSALERFGSDVAISFSGAEDVILLEYAKQSGRPFRVFSLDTGRLHPETYRFFDHVAKHYSTQIEFCFPDAGEVEALVRKKGLFSFYEEGHQECCGVRKVAPLKRYLTGVRAWITGQRRDQSPTRAAVPVVELDTTFEGIGGEPLIKLNPLANRSLDDVWAAIAAFEVPYNELHQRGVVSIGCEPCTRSVLPGQHEREGRWWWERAGSKECGLHARSRGR